MSHEKISTKKFFPWNRSGDRRWTWRSGGYFGGPPISGLCFGLAGALGGLSGSRLLMAHFDRTWTPEERKEIERAERDERNVSIREKAAYSSWYWTLYLLWAVFFLTLVLGSGFPTALVAVVITLHCVFYMVNVNRWTKKL